MKFRNSLIAIFAVLVVVIVILSNSVYTVSQTQRAIELRFDKVVRNSDGQVVVENPGLHFKIPFITSIVKMDARLQTLDDQPDRFLTLEKKDVIIDSYVKWKIDNFSKFYITTGGSIDRADSLLRRIVNDRLRSQVAQQTIIDLVSGSRSDIMNTSLAAVNDNESTSDLGIKVIDVRINKIELPDEVSNSIYARMRAERLAIAGEHRAKGREEAATIIAQTNRNVQIIEAEAEFDAQKIQAQADLQAAEIYNKTYAQSPDLFKFLATINAYKTSLETNSVLVFNPNSNSFYSNLFNNNFVTSKDIGPITLKPLDLSVLKNLDKQIPLAFPKSPSINTLDSNKNSSTDKTDNLNLSSNNNGSNSNVNNTRSSNTNDSGSVNNSVTISTNESSTDLSTFNQTNTPANPTTPVVPSKTGN